MHSIFRILSVITSFVITLIITSCSSEPKEKPNLIEEGEMMTSTVADTCLCDDLTEDSLGIHYKNDTLFTGVCIHNYPNSDLNYMVKSIMSGKLHGNVTYYDREGGVLVEEIYEDGQKKRTGDGAPQECDCTELEAVSSPGERASRYFLDGIPFTGRCFEKYADSDQVYMEIKYENGIRQGYTTFFDKDGKTMFMEKYDRGELIKTIYEGV